MQQNNRNPNNLTRTQAEAGLDQLKKWHPEESEKIELYKEIILAHVIDGVEIPSDHPLLAEKHITKPKVVSTELTATPCVRGITVFAGEGVTFLATVAGAVTAARFKKMVDRSFLSLVIETPAYEKEITPLLRTFKAAEGALAKAKAFAPIAKSFWNTSFVKVFFDVMKNNSSYLDYLIDGAIGLAQIILWVGTEFIAAIAEFVIVILSAAHLLLTGKEAVEACRA